MSKCSICLKAISANKAKLTCNECQKDFHGSCLKMSKSDIDYLVSEELVWRCTVCAAEKRKSMRFEGNLGSDSFTLDDIMKVVNEIKESVKNNEQNFNTSYEALNTRLEENTNALREQTEKVDQYLKLVDNLKTENNLLKKKVDDLEIRLENIEQYTRANTVEIQGIPEQEGEDVVQVVAEVGKALNMTITGEMIDACHRMGKRQGSSDPPNIIVKFVRRNDKEEILKKRRVKGRLSTRHMSLTMDQPIYISESLSPARRKLAAKARAVKKAHNYRFMWIRGGKIFLRKDEQSPVKQVMCQEDLNLFHKCLLIAEEENSTLDTRSVCCQWCLNILSPQSCSVTLKPQKCPKKHIRSLMKKDANSLNGFQYKLVEKIRNKPLSNTMVFRCNFCSRTTPVSCKKPLVEAKSESDEVNLEDIGKKKKKKKKDLYAGLNVAAVRSVKNIPEKVNTKQLDRVKTLDSAKKHAKKLSMKEQSRMQRVLLQAPAPKKKQSLLAAFLDNM